MPENEKMEISDVKLFLRYALPCAQTLVNRGWVERDVVELELEKAAITGETPEVDIRDIFVIAYARCTLSAKQMGKQTVDKEVIRNYFWQKHDDAIEERHKEMGDFDKKACRVLPAKVISLSPLIVETPVGEINGENSYKLDLKVGDYVSIHYSRLIEKLSPLQYNGFKKRLSSKPAATKLSEKKDNKEMIGTTLAILTAIVSGISIFANKIFVVGLDPALFTAIRALFIGLIFLLFSYANGSFNKESRRNIPWGWLFLIGVIGGGMAFLMFFSGLKMTTSGRASFLHKTLPLWVAAFAIPFLKEKITRKQGLAMTLMFGGTLLIFGSSIPAGELWSNPMMGDLLIIGATILWAIENVVARKLLREGETNFIVTFGRMFFGSLFLFGVILMTGQIGALTTLSVIQLIYLMVSTGLLFLYVFFFYWSLRFINVSKAATILLASPVITLVLGWRFLEEPITIIQLFGSVAILAGGVLISKIRSEFQTGI